MRLALILAKLKSFLYKINNVKPKSAKLQIINRIEKTESVTVNPAKKNISV